MGVDAGGTATRAVAVDATGAVVGRGTAGGGNPNSHPPGEAAAQVASAVAAALAGRPCAGCLLGMAGVSKLTDPAVAALFDSALRGVGAPSAPVVVSDAEVAFAAGATEADGTVLIAGTGSIAMRIEGRRRAATAGGHGWLLGDEGSAFWLGREAVRAALDTLQRGSAPGPFVAAVLDAAGLDTASLDTAALDTSGANAVARLITVANAQAPIALARFAPVVSAHAGDPVAAAVITRAAEALAGLVARVRRGGPVVVAGSVATATPVGAALRSLLGEVDVRTAADGVLGAGRLAAVAVFGQAGTSVRG
ncbi:N-acetylglucosamine kinase [Actinokineospora sp. 24-640]